MIINFHIHLFRLMISFEDISFGPHFAIHVSFIIKIMGESIIGLRKHDLIIKLSFLILKKYNLERSKIWNTILKLF